MSNDRFPLLFRAARAWIAFWTDRIYYRRTWVEGKDNVPRSGTPVLMVSNHQQALNDALCLVTTLRDRKPTFLARGDVFSLNRALSAFLRWIGILPAFRLKMDGAAAMQGNYASFGEAAQRLADGGTVALFPEGKHQEGHWLGEFSTGYLRIAFGAAEAAGFKKDILVQPVCNHYSEFGGMRHERLVRYGEPLSLAPYYDRYREHPGDVKKEVNAIIRARVEAMMLNVTCQDRYAETELIRKNVYGRHFAERLGKNPRRLPEKLDADRELVRRLEETDTSFGIRNLARRILDAERQMNVPDRLFDRPPGIWRTILLSLGLIVTLPVALFCMWPSLPSWLIPKHFSDRARGRMFPGTFLIALNSLVLLPLAGVLTFAAAWPLTGSFLIAAAWVASFPLLILFEWYWCAVLGLVQDRICFHLADHLGNTDEVRRMRKELDAMVGKL